MCAMMECFHPKSTILERARANQLPKLCALLVNELSAVGASTSQPQQVMMDFQSSGYESGAMDMEIDPETGMNMNGNNNCHQVDSIRDDADDMEEITEQVTKL